MERRYFIYLHESNEYDLYYFNDVLRSASKHFLIDFEEEESLFTFLKEVKDGFYPHRIIVDFYDWQRVKDFITKLRGQQELSFLHVVVLRTRSEDVNVYQDVELFRRPKNSAGWEALVLKLLA
jgi:hypothetical protein